MRSPLFSSSFLCWQPTKVQCKVRRADQFSDQRKDEFPAAAAAEGASTDDRGVSCLL